MLPTAAQAQSVWSGPGSTTNTSDYNLNTNWGPAASPVAPGQSAVFRNNGKVNVNVTAGPISPDSWTFNANAKSFNISGADVNFSLAGANGGIINKANSGQTLTISNNIGETLAGVRVQQTGNSTLILSGANTYTGNTTISAGTLQVTNNNSVGTGNVVLNGGTFQADGVSDLKFNNRFRMNAGGGTIDANGASLTLSGNIVDGAGAGPLLIRDSSFGSGRVIMTGNNTYTGGTTICACATLQLGTSGNLGSIVGAVTNEGVFNIVNANTSGITTVTNQSGAFLTFRNATDAGTMTIDNHVFASTTFNNASAGSATINNIGGFGFGVVEFNKASTAADATINNAGTNFVVFNDQATLEGAKIVNKDAGLVLFNAQSSAGNAAASITNNDQGQVHFSNQSTAGSATITNNDFGVLDFNNRSSADNATIINSSAIGMAFLNRSTAGNAFITTNNNSATFFFGRSDGGTARFETEAGSIVDFSGSRGANNDGRINAGSIAGAGNYYIGGGNTLVVGGNDRSTEVSGVIADTCGCGPGGPGALEKTGLGTLVLSGANTYSGGTTITAGTLQLGNGGASGSILGDVVDNGIFAINRSDAFTFGGVISGSGAFQQIGDGATTLTNTNTYTGPTTVSAGTLIVAAGGSITSDVTNNATFNNLGTVTGSLTNTGTASNSGTISNGLTNFSGTTTNTGTINGGATVEAGTLNTNTATSVINGGLLNAGTINAQGQINGAINNNLNDFNVTGNLSSDSTFANAKNARLNINAGTYTIAGAVTNFGQIKVAAGATLTATAAGIGNGQFSGSIDNKGTINAALTNSGLVTNDGIYNGTVMNGGAGGIVNNAAGTWNGNVILNFGLSGITNSGIWNGNIQSNDSTINNNLTWNGTVSNIPNVANGFQTFNNGASGTVSGLVTNAGLVTNSGTLNGGLSNLAGTTTNSGTINGGATVTGGTLNTNSAASMVAGGLTNSGTVNAAGIVNGAIANNAGTFTVTGDLASDSTFTNAAAGTLAIGAATYTLQGLLTNSGAMTVAGMGQLNAAGGITNKAGGTITIASGGTVHDDLNNAGAVTNSGFYFANVASNTGLITNNASWIGNLVSNSGTIANSGFWSGTVSNAGMFDNPGFVQGLFTNTAGVAVNNGFLNAGARVTGGMLTGSGFVIGDLTLSGGAFLPGNGAPGSFMTVTGNLAFQSGALYLVQLNPATSTLAKVTGTASLNGSAGAAFLAGNYVAKQYTILTAGGGVSGTFSSFDTLGVPTGFQTSLSYDAHNVFLNLDFVLAKYAGLNVNQQNVANALVNSFNATGGISAVFGTLTPGGLAQASGELATRTQQTSFEAMNLFLGLLTDPFVAGRGEGAAPPAGASQFAEENDANAYASGAKPRTKSEREAYAAMIYRKASIRDSYDPRWSVWAAGYGGSQTTDGNTVLGSNTARSSIGGVAVGADYRFSPNTLAGFAISGGGTGFSVANSGTGRSDLFQAGAFVRHTIGPAYISAALAYGWQDVTTDRIVTIAGSDLLRANFNANTFSGRAEGGYRFVAPWIGGVGITPYAAGQFTTIDLPAYTEQAIAGANTFALTYTSKSVTDTRSELGIRTDKSFAMQNGIFTLRGRAAWVHDFNPDRNIAATFQTLPGASFVVNGAAQASDAALVTGSAEMKWLNGFSLAATFEGEFSGVTRSYAGKGVARYAW